MESIENKTYKFKNFNSDKLVLAEYDCCTFIDCSFTGAKLSRIRFIECEFKGCDLSNLPLHETNFQDTQFTDCKLLGLHFEDCNAFNFSASFIDCKLDDSSFYQVKVKNVVFESCSLQRVDFTEAIAEGVSFQDCHMLGAVFDNSNIEKADFRTAVYFRIDPTRNKVKGAFFSKEGAIGLLDTFKVKIG